MYRCRILCSALLTLLLTLPLWAANEEADRNPGSPLDQGGETCATAVAITTLPFCDTGTTANHINDYPVPCNTGSAAPDVVYSITPPVTSVLSFSLCGSAYNTALTIWRGCPSAGGVLICCSDNVCGDDACCSGVTLLANVQYFVVVDGGSTAPIAGNYQLNVVQGEACPNTPCQSICPFPNGDVEPNNICSGGGTVLTCGDTVCGHITPGIDGQDYYYLDIQGPGCQNVTIDVFGDDTPGYFPFAQGLNPTVYIINIACDSTIAVDFNSGVGEDARIDSVCLPTGLYRVYVSGDPVNQSFGPYIISLACTPCECPTCPYPNQDIEPNNVCSGGGAVIACGDTTCGEITPNGDNDYYYLRVDGPSCQLVTIDVFADDTPGQFPFGQGLNPLLVIYTPGCGAVVASDTMGGIGEDARLQLCLEPGTYRVLVRQESDTPLTFGPYILATSCTPCECPDTCNYPNRDNEGVNNTCGTFNPPMVCGDTLCGDIAAATDVDWYLITVVGPGSIRLKVDVFGDDTPGFYPFGQGLDPMVRVVGVGCTSILGVDTASGVGEDAHLEICLTQGTYNIQVQQEDFTTGPYILATACEPCDTCPYPSLDIEPLNDNCGTFNPIIHCGDALCGDITQDHGINDDWYVLQLTQCTQLFIDVMGDDTPGFYPFGQGLNTAVELWRADCQQVLYQDQNSGIGEDARLNTPCLDPGIYMLRIYGENLTEGPYIVFVGCENCTCIPPCEITCPPQALLENEPCPSYIDTTDGGCDTEPHRFLPLGCGDTYCGTGFSDQNYTDTDWYSLRVSDPSQVRLCVASTFNGYLNIYRRGPSLDPCVHRDLLDCIFVVGCQGTQCLSLCLPVGVYLVEFRPTGFEPVNCWDYVLTTQCSPCEPTVCIAPDSLVIHYPDSMGVSDSLENVALYWSAVPGATEYRIYRTSNNNSLLIVQPANYVASTANTFFLHEGVIDNNGVNEIWIYEVVAYCGTNHEPCDVVPTAVMPKEPQMIQPRE